MLVLRRVMPAPVVGAGQHDKSIAFVHVGKDTFVDAGRVWPVGRPRLVSLAHSRAEIREAYQR